MKTTTDVRREDARDQGVTLTELLVSMGIFTIVLAVFFGGLISMSRSTLRAQDVINAGDSTRAAFQTMDKQIRYASSINRPGFGPSGAQYVEFVITALPDGQPPRCTQWRFDPTARTLAYRNWNDLPGAVRGTWRVVAWEVRNDLTATPPVKPFTLEVAGGIYTRQRLAVALDVGRGSGGSGAIVGADSATVFAARNSSESSPSNEDLDGNGVSDHPVCTPMERP